MGRKKAEEILRSKGISKEDVISLTRLTVQFLEKIADVFQEGDEYDKLFLVSLEHELKYHSETSLFRLYLSEVIQETKEKLQSLMDSPLPYGFDEWLSELSPFKIAVSFVCLECGQEIPATSCGLDINEACDCIVSKDDRKILRGRG